MKIIKRGYRPRYQHQNLGYHPLRQTIHQHDSRHQHQLSRQASSAPSWGSCTVLIALAFALQAVRCDANLKQQCNFLCFTQVQHKTGAAVPPQSRQLFLGHQSCHKRNSKKRTSTFIIIRWSKRNPQYLKETYLCEVPSIWLEFFPSFS